MFHFISWNILSHLEVEMIKKCSVSESQKWNISMMSKENLPICLNISLIKKYRDFIFFSICFSGREKKKVLSLNTSKWDETLFWQTPENRPINVVQTFPPVVAITDKTTSKNLSHRNMCIICSIKAHSSLRCHCIALSENPADPGSHTSAVWYPNHCPKVIWRHNSFTLGRGTA